MSMARSLAFSDRSAATIRTMLEYVTSAIIPSRQ
jgi:hypothetical protein